MNLKLAAVLLVTLLCLLWVLHGVPLEEVRAALAGFRWWVLLLAYAAYTLAHALRALRLGLLLGRGLSFGRLFRVTAVGFLAINVMPLRAGEFVRPYLLFEEDGVPLGSSLAAIFLERVLDFAALLAMLLLAGLVDLPLEDLHLLGVDVVSAGRHLAAVVVGGGLLAAGLVAVLGELVARFLEARSWGPLRRLGGFARGFRQGVLPLFRSPGRSLLLLLVTAAIWSSTLLGVGLVFRGAGLAGLGPAAPLVVWSLTLATMSAVPTPGFFGGYEAACTGALRLLGVEPARSVTVAFLLHFSMFSFIAGVGTVFLLLEGWSLGQVVRRSREAVRGSPAPPPGSPG